MDTKIPSTIELNLFWDSRRKNVEENRIDTEKMKLGGDSEKGKK